MAKINLFALGGQDENGKNMFVVEIGQDIFVFNAGIKFPINDLWGVDGIIPDVDYLEKNKDRIKGFFITHAHDETFSALPWIIMKVDKIKIYGSKFTIAAARERIAKYKIGDSRYSFKEISSLEKIDNYEIRSFSMTASIPGALIYSLRTSDGDIVFMAGGAIGDLGIFGHTDLARIHQECPNILTLILDSRRANFPGHAIDKKSVVPFIEQKIAQAKPQQRIIFGAFDEEMYNLQEVIDLANKYKRPIAFYGSAFDSLYNNMVTNYPNVQKPNKQIDYRRINHTPNAVVLVTGIWSRLNDRFNRISFGKDVYLKLKPSDVVIMNTPPKNGMEVAYARALDNIAMIVPDITSIENKDVVPLQPAKGDIETIVKKLHPKFFLPVGSLYRYQMEAGKTAIAAGVRKDRMIVLPNGKIAYLQNGEVASLKGKVSPFGDVIIQGYGIGDISYEVIKERKSLSAGGLVAIAVQYSRSQKQLVGEPSIYITGVVVKTELPKYQAEVKNVLIQKFEMQNQFDYRELQSAVRKRLQKVFFRKTGKEPLVVTTFCEV